MIAKESKDILLAIPGVVGVGHGFKEKAGANTRQEAIVVLVKKKLPAAQLPEAHLIPANVDDLPTDVIEIGEFTAYRPQSMSVAVAEIGHEYSPEIERTARVRPAMPGLSIGHYAVTAGTLGAIVYDRKTAQPLILSNNHILANSSSGRDGRARIGDPILQPGPADGGFASNNVIAKLSKYVTLDQYPLPNTMDCALAKPLKNNLISPEILDIGQVKGSTDPVLGLNVKKSGRTTRVTTGQIRAIDVTADINYGAGRVLRFDDQILTTKMSEGGDSGSLVLDANNLAVGLLFAGSAEGTLVNPIKPILDLLKVRF